MADRLASLDAYHGAGMAWLGHCRGAYDLESLWPPLVRKTFCSFLPCSTPPHLTMSCYQIGISYVSIAKARASIARETAGKDFATIRAEAAASWEQALSRDS